MTTQKTFKRHVRARMAKTGESYTAARRVPIANGDRPEPAADFEPPVSEERLSEHRARLGPLVGLLDAWDATNHTHTEIARWLVDGAGRAAAGGRIDHRRVRARPRHAGHGSARGRLAVSATKTVGVPVERLFAAFPDETLRERWLPGAELRLRTATPPRPARYDWEDGRPGVLGFTRRAPAQEPPGAGPRKAAGRGRRRRDEALVARTRLRPQERCSRKEVPNDREGRAGPRRVHAGIIQGRPSRARRRCCRPDP